MKIQNQKWKLKNENSKLKMKIHFKESFILWYDLLKQLRGSTMLTPEEQKQAELLAKGIRRLSLEQLNDPEAIYNLMKTIQKKSRHTSK